MKRLGLGVALLLVFGACGDDTAATTTTHAVISSTTTTTLLATTTQPPTTTATEPPTTTATATEAPTTTTTLPAPDATPQEVFDGSLPDILETSLRAWWMGFFEGFDEVMSVDVLVLDQDTRTFVIDVTSVWSTQGKLEDSTWGIYRALAFWWGPEGIWVGEEGTHEDLVWPNLRLTVSGLTWECPDMFLRELADAKPSRADWEANCGQ